MFQIVEKVNNSTANYKFKLSLVYAFNNVALLKSKEAVEQHSEHFFQHSRSRRSFDGHHDHHRLVLAHQHFANVSNITLLVFSSHHVTTYN